MSQNSFKGYTLSEKELKHMSQSNFSLITLLHKELLQKNKKFHNLFLQLSINNSLLM